MHMCTFVLMCTGMHIHVGGHECLTCIWRWEGPICLPYLKGKLRHSKLSFCFVFLHGIYHYLTIIYSLSVSCVSPTRWQLYEVKALASVFTVIYTCSTQKSAWLIVYVCIGAQETGGIKWLDG